MPKIGDRIPDEAWHHLRQADSRHPLALAYDIGNDSYWLIVSQVIVGMIPADMAEEVRTVMNANIPLLRAILGQNNK